MYDDNKIKSVVNHLQKKLKDKTAEPYEIITTLILLLQAGHIDKQNIKNMIKAVFENNQEEMIRGLYKTNLILDKDLIDSIMSSL